MSGETPLVVCEHNTAQMCTHSSDTVGDTEREDSST